MERKSLGTRARVLDPISQLKTQVQTLTETVQAIKEAGLLGDSSQGKSAIKLVEKGLGVLEKGVERIQLQPPQERKIMQWTPEMAQVMQQIQGQAPVSFGQPPISPTAPAESPLSKTGDSSVRAIPRAFASERKEEVQAS